MKKLTVILMVAVSFLATHVLAGTLTVNGDLATATNLSAQSITLGGVIQTNWPNTSAVGAINLTNAVLDFSQTGLLYQVTLTNNISWVFTNHVAGRIVYLQITENGTGGWTNTWPAGLLWPENQIINASTVSNDISVYEILDNGSSWLAQAEGLDYGVACTNDCYALAFNGGNNITVDQTSLWAPTNFTFEAWVKSNQGQPSGDWGALAATEEFGGATTGWMALFGSDGHFRFGGILQGNTDFGVEGSVTINDGAWHHVAATYNGTNIVLYVDGQQDGSPTAVSGLLAATSELNLGVLPGGSYNYYGTLDEVRISKTVIYNTASFTPAYHLTAGSETVGLWTFAEGSGSTAHDSTADHNGTLVGSPAWVTGR